MSAAQSAVERLLGSNAQWAEDVKQAEPDFFTECAKGQSPHVLSLAVLSCYHSDVLFRRSGLVAQTLEFLTPL